MPLKGTRDIDKYDKSPVFRVKSNRSDENGIALTVQMRYTEYVGSGVRKRLFSDLTAATIAIVSIVCKFSIVSIVFLGD